MAMYNEICELINWIDFANYYLVKQQDFNGMKILHNIIALIKSLLENDEISADQKSELLEISKGILEGQAFKDNILIVDTLGLQLKRFCMQKLEGMRMEGIWKEVKDFYEMNISLLDDETKSQLKSLKVYDENSIPDEYSLIENNIGTFSLCKNTDSMIHFNTIDNPALEALRMVDEYKSDKNSYVVLGLSMGYLPMQLALEEDVVEVCVYEHDINVIRATLHYTDMTNALATGKLKLIYDPKLSGFAKKIKYDIDKCTIIIHRPAMVNISDSKLRSVVEDFYIKESSVRCQVKSLLGNFAYNIGLKELKEIHFVDELKSKFADKQIIVVAAGPSLNEQLQSLKEKRNDYVVVTVGTSLRRLLNNGINPDFVVMTDPQDTMVSQIEGIDTSFLTLLYLSTLSHLVVDRWKGDKYAVLQKDFENSEKLAEEINTTLYETGGSVSTLALDICLKMRAKSITCLGLDLAFTDNKRHFTDDVSNVNSKDESRLVKSVDGKKVATAINLDNYRLWIENRLLRKSDSEKNIRIYNVSRGAYIEGMENSTDWRIDG